MSVGLSFFHAAMDERIDLMFYLQLDNYVVGGAKSDIGYFLSRNGNEVVGNS